MKVNVDPLTESEYAKSFQVFAQRSSEYDAMITWVRDYFDSSVRSILSIGAGSGYFDEQIIDYLRPERYVAVEPNQILRE